MVKLLVDRPVIIARGETPRLRRYRAGICVTFTITKLLRLILWEVWVIEKREAGRKLR